MGIIKSTYRGAKKTVNWFQNLIAWAIMAFLGAGGVYSIYLSISGYSTGENELAVTLVMILMGLGLLSFPLVMIRERLRDRKLMRWLGENAEGLAEGIEGPGGVVYSFDTILVRYEANLSLVVVGTGFESSFYIHGTSHLLPKLLYTLFTAVFGWWMLDVQVIFGNAAAIVNNLRDTNVVTVGELFDPESAG